MNKEASNLLAKLVTEIYKNGQLQQKVNQLEKEVERLKEREKLVTKHYVNMTKHASNLEDKIIQLETNRDEAIRYIKAYMPSFQNYIASDTEFNAKEILSILERGKE